MTNTLDFYNETNELYKIRNNKVFLFYSKMYKI